MAGKKNYWIYGCSGCLAVVFLVFILLIAGVGYIGYQGYKFGTEIHNKYVEMVNEYAELNDKYPFTPPQDKIMDPAKVSTYLTVRSSLIQISRENFQQFESIGKEIEKQFEEPGIMSKIQGIGKVKEIVQHAVTIGASIGKEHIAILDEQEMSPHAYRWYTQTYLATLAKAEENGFTDGAEKWNAYIEAFNKDRKNHQETDVNLGDRHIRGEQINKDNLMEKLKPVPFKSQNQEYVKETLDKLTVENQATILDFMALHLEEIMNEFAKKQNKPEQPASPGHSG